MPQDFEHDGFNSPREVELAQQKDRNKVKPIRRDRPDLARVAESIKTKIYDQMPNSSLAEVIGVLEIVKHELIEAHQ